MVQILLRFNKTLWYAISQQEKRWFDATAGNYDKLLENPQETGSKVLEIIGNKVGNTFPLTVAFLVEDLAREESVKNLVIGRIESLPLP